MNTIILGELSLRRSLYESLRRRRTPGLPLASESAFNL